jgi:ATP-dependent Lon protease
VEQGDVAEILQLRLALRGGHSQEVRALKDLPKKIRMQLRIIPVEFVDDVLRVALLLEKPEEFGRKPTSDAGLKVPSVSETQSAPAGAPV